MLPTVEINRCEADVLLGYPIDLPLLVIESCNALVALSTSSIFAANFSKWLFALATIPIDLQAVCSCLLHIKKRPVNIYRPLLRSNQVNYWAPALKLSTGTHWPFSTLYTVMATSFKSPLSS